jgi:hypothetical protein
MDPLSIAMVGLNVVGGLFSTFQAAKQAKANSRYAIEEFKGQWQQVGIQNEQLIDEAKSVGMAAELAVAKRMEQALKVKTNNAAVQSASGTSFNASQAIAAQETDKNARKDAQVIEYNTALQGKRIADQIKVNRMSLETAKKRAAATISNGTAVQAGIKLGESLLSSGIGGGGPGMTKG